MIQHSLRALVGVLGLLLAPRAQADFAGLCQPNTVVAGPASGQAAPPDCRLLTPADIPAPIDNTINVVTLGADPSGHNDSAPAFRLAAAQASNHSIRVPPGTYLFASQIPNGGYTTLNPANVRFFGQSNFILSMYGATFNVSDAASFTSMFQFDADNGFTVLGGTFNGNHAGTSTIQEAVGITVFNVVGAKFEGQTFNGNWGGIGSAFAGDWIVNGVFRDIVMNAVGQCFDVAFLHNVVFDGIQAYGADASGFHGVNQVGSKCFSFIYDSTNSVINGTGFVYNDTDGVSIVNSSAYNFIYGFYISSGKNYTLSGNHWESNLGCSALLGTCATVNATAGYGGLIGGSVVGFPPKNITISGDTFDSNGNVTAGGSGLFLYTGSMGGSDVMRNIAVRGIFDNNRTAAIDVSPAVGSKLQGLDLDKIRCSGANQTSCITANAASALQTTGTVGLITSLQTSGGISYDESSPVIGTGGGTRVARLPSNGGGTSPTVGSGSSDCGTNPAITGSNLMGVVTVGSGANGGLCTVTFSATWPGNNGPFCNVWNTSAAARQLYPVSTPTFLQLRATSTLSVGDNLTYQCESSGAS